MSDRFKSSIIVVVLLLCMTILNISVSFAESYEFDGITINLSNKWIAVTEMNYLDQDEKLQEVFNNCKERFGETFQMFAISEDYQYYWYLTVEDTDLPDFSMFDDDDFKEMFSDIEGETTDDGATVESIDYELYYDADYVYIASHELLTRDDIKRNILTYWTVVHNKAYTFTAYTDNGKVFTDKQEEGLQSVIDAAEYEWFPELPNEESYNDSTLTKFSGNKNPILVIYALIATVIGFAGILFIRRKNNRSENHKNDTNTKADNSKENNKESIQQYDNPETDLYDISVGDVWHGWTVDAFIGEGSYGKVYKLTKKEYGHTYESALKVISIPQNHSEIETIRSEGMSEESVTSYFRSKVEDLVSELAIMSELKGHSNIVSYEDHFVEKDKDSPRWNIYLRMELLTPLLEYIKENDYNTCDVIELGIDICKALELCEKYNIIHRDIKTGNIFVSKQGSYKLGDFGIARKLETESSEMSKKGTTSFMAPEVYRGMIYDLTADIYSLGIVLYRLLNYNRNPFLPQYPEPIRYLDNQEATNKRMSGEALLPPINASNDLAEIVLKACSYRPESRYQNASEMRLALEDVGKKHKNDFGSLFPSKQYNAEDEETDSI